METRLYLYKNYRQLGDSNDWNEVYDPLVINGEHLFISNYTVDTMFMGGASTITAQIKHSQELDNVLKNVYILWEKEIFKLNFISSSKYNNETPFYIHDVRFVSLHSILANVYLTDESVDDNVLMQNGTTRFSFYGTLKEFAVKINKSLKASGLSEYEIEGLTSVAGYKVEVDENIETEPKSISFEDTYILNALQRLYEEFEIPYRFEGGGYKTTIRFAPIANIIDERFEYGVDNPLVSISKNYEDTKRVNKVTGYGSSKNIEYYYPNPTSRGFIEAKTYGEFYIKTDDPILFNEKIRMDSKIVYSGGNGIVFNSGIITPLDFSFVSGKSKIGDYTLEGGFLKRNLTTEDRTHFSILWFDANNDLMSSTYGDKSISSENNGVAIGEIKTICDPQEQYKAFYNNYDIINPRYNTTNAPAINYTGSINYRYEFDYKLSRKNETKYFSYKFTITSYDKIGNGEHLAYIRVYHGKNNVIYERNGADAYHDKSSIVQFDYNFFLDDSTSEDIRVVVVASGAQGNKAATSEIFVSCQVTPNIDDKLWYDETKKVSYKDLSEMGLSLSGGTYEIGDYIVPNVYKYISPTSNLVPPIFRDTNGEELFYFAKDYPFEKTEDYVINEQIGEYIGSDGLVHNDYIESNVGSNEIQYPYTEGNAVEHIFSYEDIYPTIKGGTYLLDGKTYEIDKFADFGYDSNDNDEFVGEEAEHSYFFAKLNPLGFNLFSHASANGEMEVSFTSGHLAGCVCKIVVDENSQKNVVKIDSNGNLVQENGKVAFWNSIPSKENNEAEYNLYLKQNDTTNNSVWVALMKDNSTYGVLMPSVNANIKPAVGDSFVLTNIVMPTKYLEDAEKRLEKAIMADLLLNNSETFSFSIVFSDLYWTREKLETILPKLLAFNRILLSYNNEEYTYYIKSINIKVNSDAILPKVTIDISDTMAIQTGALNNIVSALDKKFVTVIANNTAQIVKTQEEYQNALDTAISTVGDTIRMYKDVEAVQNMSVDFDLGVGGTVVSQMASARRSNIDEELQLGNYVEGSAGASLLKRPDGSTYMEVDRLKVRMKAIFEELEVQKVNTIGGSLIMSPAGSLTCTRVATRSELISDYGYLEPEYPTNDQETLASIEKSFSSLNFYRCFFKNEEDDVTITNYFQVGDLAYCKTFNTGNNENRFYWRQVVSVGRDYIDLAVDICASDSDIPLVGDVICHLGNKGFEAISTGFTVEQDPYRQSAIMMSSVDEFSPSITLYQGINEFSYADKAVIQYGAIKWLENGESVAKAFFNVYGDMYIGDKPKEDGSESYMRYDTEDGLIVKGKLIVQGKGKTVEELIAEATPQDYDEFKSAVEKAQEDIDGLQKQIDGAIETWFYEGVPALDNAPAKDWTTEEIKNVHLGDLYYDGKTGKAYRFQMKESNYVWELITDTDIQAALDAASKAQDTADNKRRIFVEQPTPPYDKGDLWSQGNDKPLKICITARTTGSFVEKDWDFADNLNDVAEDAKKALENTQTLSEDLSTLSGVVDVFKEDVNGAFRDGIITEEEKSRINGYTKQIEGVYNDVNASYIQVINSEFLENTQELNTLKTAIDDFNSVVSDLLSFIGDISSFDGEKDDFTKLVIQFNSKYGNFNSSYAYVSSAIFAANNKINSVLSAKIEDYYTKITDDYSYLTNALNGKTIEDGGLILTSMIALGVFSGEGNSTFTTKSGINGTYGSTQQDSDTIAFWAGGEMKDLFKYNKDENGNWIATEGDNPADFLVRMDGTGYAAGGRFSWDKDGKITADPLSFFVGEDSVGKLLASFQIVDVGNGDWYLTPQKYFDGLTIKGKPLFAEEAKISKLTIGNAVFVWDDTNSILRVEHQQSGKVANFLASGAVATRGLGEIEEGGGGTGTGVDLLNVPSDIIPIVGGTYSLGTSGKPWKELFVGDIQSENIMPSSHYTYSLGADENRWSKIYGVDIYATRFTMNGEAVATRNWVNSQSFAKTSDLTSINNNISSLQASTFTGANNPEGKGYTLTWFTQSGGGRNVTIPAYGEITDGLAGIGQNVALVDQWLIADLMDYIAEVAAGGNVDLTSVASDIIPDGNLTRKLGSSSNRWSLLYVNSINAGTIAPRTDNGWDLGMTTFRWRNLYAVDGHLDSLTIGGETAATQSYVTSQLGSYATTSALSSYATNEALSSESGARRGSTLSGTQLNGQGYSVTWQTSQAGAQTVTIPTFGSLGYESIDDYYNKNGLESFLVDGVLMDSLLIHIEDAISAGCNIDLSNYVNVEGGTINNAKLTGDVTGNGWSIEGGIANFGEVNTDSLYINGEGVLTSSSLANYVTLNSEQTITERKTFTGGITVQNGITASRLYSVDYLDSSELIINAEKVNFIYDGDDADVQIGLINGYKPLTLGNTSFSSALSSGTVIGTITIGGESKTIYVPNGGNVTSGGKINLVTVSAATISSYMASVGDDGIKMFIVTDSNGNIPSLNGETSITVSGTAKLLLFGKSKPFGVSVGDILAVTKLQCRIIPLNDAKAANGDFPGADGLETVWDKTQINKIAGIEYTANAALPRTSLLPSSGVSNMNDALETGIYVWCTLGRPSGATGAFTCVVHRSSTPDFNNFYTIEQTAYGREAELGQVYKRIIFWRSDEQQYGEWVRVDNTNSADLSNYVTLDGEQTITGSKYFSDLNANSIYLQGFELKPYNPNNATPDRLMYDGYVLLDEYNYKDYLVGDLDILSKGLQESSPLYDLSYLDYIRNYVSGKNLSVVVYNQNSESESINAASVALNVGNSANRIFRIISYKWGDLYWQKGNGNGDGWDSMRTILDSSNYATTLDRAYVKKSGGTVTGKLGFSGSIYPNIYGNGNFLVLSASSDGLYGLTIDKQSAAIRARLDKTTRLGTSAVRWSNVHSVLGDFSGQITSSVADGTAPFVVASKTLVSNLNADMLDGYHESSFFRNKGWGAGIIDADQLLFGAYNDNDFVNTPVKNGQLIAFNALDGNYQGGQLMFGNQNTLYSRIHWGGNYNAWKQIAFTDSNVASADKLSTPRTIAISGAVTGTATTFDGSSNISINTTSVDANYVGGYFGCTFDKKVYYGHHPENRSGIIPFLYNDLAHLVARGGSCTMYITTDTDYTQPTLTNARTIGSDYTKLFDGSPGYLGYTVSSLTDVVVVDVTLPKAFGYTTQFYIDFGSSNWKAKDVSVYVWNNSTNNSEQVYTLKGSITNNGKNAFYISDVSYSYTDTSGTKIQGFNRLRVVLTNFVATSPRIAQIGLIQYGSIGLRYGYMSLGIDDQLYRSLTPAKNSTYNLGSGNNRWLNIYGTNADFTGSVTTQSIIGVSSKVLVISSTNDDLALRRNHTDATSVVLNGSAFKPHNAANGLLDLGSTSARWKGIYGQSLGLSRGATIGGSLSLTNNAPEILFYRDGESSWKILNYSNGNFYIQNNYTTAVQSNYFTVLQLNRNTGNATLKGSLTTGGDAIVGGKLDLYDELVINSHDYIHEINGNADGELVIWPSEYLVIENDTITDYAITCSELVQTSDVRYKNILSNVHLKLSDIAAAPTFKFAWANEIDGITHLGTSAQYWQEIAGELVVENKKTGKLGLDYSTAALVSAISIAREVNTMKMWQTSTTDRIEELEDKVKKLEEENKALRELLNSK